MKDFAYYSQGVVPRPNKADYTTFYVYDKGKCVFSGVGEEAKRAKNLLVAKNPEVTSQVILDENAYKAQMRQYTSDQFRLFEEFKADLFEELGVSDSPKKDACFSLAWQFSHANGYAEVYETFSDLAELIKL